MYFNLPNKSPLVFPKERHWAATKKNGRPQPSSPPRSNGRGPVGTAEGEGLEVGQLRDFRGLNIWKKKEKYGNMWKIYEKIMKTYENMKLKFKELG